MDRVWPGAIVEDNTIQFHMSAIRKALGQDRGIFQTAFGRGYGLLGVLDGPAGEHIAVDSGPISTGMVPSPDPPFITNCHWRRPS